jgi:heptosyltransferase-2
MKILLVQTSFLGDIILSTPLIGALKKRYPQADIWMLTTPAGEALVSRDPFLGGVLIFDKRRNDAGLKGLWLTAQRLKSDRFDRVYSLHRSVRTTLLLWLSRIPQRIGYRQAKLHFLYHRTVPRPRAPHDVIRNLSLLSDDMPNADIKKGVLRLFPPVLEELSSPIAAIYRQLQNSPYIVLVPGSAWHTKQWHWRNYRQVAQHFHDQGYPVVLLGANTDKATTTAITRGLDMLDLAGQTSIAEAMFIVKHAGLVVCNDSMSLHLCSAFKVPNVAIYCATSPKFGFGPWRNRAVVVEKNDLPCKPCHRHGSAKCPIGTEACMRELPPQTVIEAAESLLAIK